jgi:hypothetical protein
VASMSDKALREQVLQDLTHVVTVKVKPVWISAALSAVQREKRERRVRPKRDAIDVVRSTMMEMGIDKEEPFSVSGAIVARLQAMNEVMENRDVGDALTKALAGGVLNVARALVRTPLHIGTQMIWRKRNCISTRRNSVMRSSDILSGVEGRYENVERDVNIE